MKSRKYASSLEVALDGPQLSRRRLPHADRRDQPGLPQLHRYFELRRQMLGLPDMHYYDIYPPLVQLGPPLHLDPDARRRALEAMRPLGATLCSRHFADATAAASGWIRSRGPASAPGAYMNGGIFDVHPYLLLNLSDQYDGLSTYAHEWGHAMHSLLAKEAQPYELSGYADVHRRDRLDRQRAAAVHT